MLILGFFLGTLLYVGVVLLILKAYGEVIVRRSKQLLRKHRTLEVGLTLLPWLGAALAFEQIDLAPAFSEARVFALLGLALLLAVAIPLAALRIALDVQKHADEDEAAELQEALQACDTGRNADRQRLVKQLSLGATLQRVVGAKADRLRKLLDDRSKQGAGSTLNLDEVLAAMDPVGQIQHNLILLQEYFHRTLPEPTGGEPARLRVALYENRGGVYSPTTGFDGLNAGVACISVTPGHHDKWLSVQEPAKSLVVAAAQKRGLVRANDADRCHSRENHPFHHFNPAKSSNIRSAFAYPVMRAADPSPARWVLAVDTNLERFWTDWPDDLLIQILDEISCRLLYEIDVTAVVNDLRSTVAPS